MVERFDCGVRIDRSHTMVTESKLVRKDSKFLDIKFVSVLLLGLNGTLCLVWHDSHYNTGTPNPFYN